MSRNPINLAIRFLLELISLLAMGLWGYSLIDGWYRFLPAVGIPLIAGIFWGVFAVPDDPSRSGKTVVKTPGIVRLILELVFFYLGGWALFELGYIKMVWFYSATTLLHYILSYDRILWLIKQ